MRGRKNPGANPILDLSRLCTGKEYQSMTTITQSEWNDLVQIRRELHAHPELSGQEFKTMDRICAWLDQWDIPYQKGVADTGVVATLKGGKPGRCVGVRADIDALPIQEENTDLPYRSLTPKVMHACGHDVHTTIALGTAKKLREMLPELSGTVKFFFQPNEEDTGGAERMIQAGCLDDPHVDCIVGLHVDPAYPAGTVGIRYGKMYAASDMLKLKVYGGSSHGAKPHQGTDAIITTAAILMTLQTLVSRNTSPTDSVVCSFGTIHGGNVRNQIADYVEAEGILRTIDPNTRQSSKARLQQLCSDVAAGMGARAELSIQESYGPLINTDQITDVVRKNAEELLGCDHVVLEKEPDLGTEDFSYFAAARPSCFFHLGCAPSDGSPVECLHNCRFNVDEACIATGVNMQLKNVRSLLTL